MFYQWHLAMHPIDYLNMNAPGRIPCSLNGVAFAAKRRETNLLKHWAYQSSLNQASTMW